MLYNFKLPKGRGDGYMTLVYSAFAFNPMLTQAEGFLEFQEVVSSSRVKEHFECLGAAQVQIITFQNHDGNTSAATAFNQVHKMLHSPGFQSISKGTCNPKLATKAKELLAAAAEKQQMNSAEFDEKTKAVLQQTMAVAEKISESMVTKDDLQLLGESSKKSSDELKSSVGEIQSSVGAIKNTITKDYETVICRQRLEITGLRETCEGQARTITSLQEVIEAKESEKSFLTNKNLSQTQVIARLNEERDISNRRILTLQQEKSALLQERLAQTSNGSSSSTCEANLANLDKVVNKIQRTQEEMQSMLSEVWQEIKKQRCSI